MNTGMIVTIVILLILVAVLVVLYFLGKRAQTRQQEQQAQIEANTQNVSMFIIDKKKLRIKESGLPQQVIDQVPWYLRRSKIPIIMARVGAQTMRFIGDDKVFDSIPVKKEVKAQVSGLYIVGAKGIHGKRTAVEAPKKSRFKQLLDKAREKAGATPLK